MSKKRTSFFWILFFGFNAFTQKADSSLISRHRPGFMWYYGNVHSLDRLNVTRYDRMIVDVYYSDWGSKEFSFFKSNFKSIGFNVQSLFDSPLNKKNTVGIGWGIGYGHLRIESNYILNQSINSNATLLSLNLPNSGIERFYFTANQIFVPVELRLRTEGWSHFKFQFGGKIGYSFLPNKHLFIRNNEGKLQENITANFNDFNPLLLSIHARAGIRNWAIFASYNLVPFFKEKSSTQLFGLQIGLSVSPY